jgi:hypothetical protein
MVQSSKLQDRSLKANNMSVHHNPPFLRSLSPLLGQLVPDIDDRLSHFWMLTHQVICITTYSSSQGTGISPVWRPCNEASMQMK